MPRLQRSLIPHKQGMKGETLEYDWYYRTDGQGRFSLDDLHVKTGHEFDGPYLPGGGLWEVQFGPFGLEWSGSFPNWGYLYYRIFEHALPPFDHLRIATTDAKSVELIDARDPKWIYLAYPGDEGVPGNVDLMPPAKE